MRFTDDLRPAKAADLFDAMSVLVSQGSRWCIRHVRFGSRLCENAGGNCWGATIEPKDAVSEISSCALGERFESIVRPDDP